MPTLLFQQIFFFQNYVSVLLVGVILIGTASIKLDSTRWDEKNVPLALITTPSFIIGSINIILLSSYLLGILGNHYLKIYSMEFNFLSLFILPWFQNGWYYFGMILLLFWIPTIPIIIIQIMVPQASEIIPNKVYLGNGKAALSDEFITKNGITHIVELYAEKSPNDLKIVSRNDTIQVLQLKCSDYLGSHGQLLQIASEGIQFIDNAIQNDSSSSPVSEKNSSKVLVHCTAGCSRSPALVVLWLSKTNVLKKMTVKDAYRHVRHVRPCVDINTDHWHEILEDSKSVKTHNLQT